MKGPMLFEEAALPIPKVIWFPGELKCETFGSGTYFRKVFGLLRIGVILVSFGLRKEFA
jgi:hypothetical protein